MLKKSNRTEKHIADKGTIRSQKAKHIAMDLSYNYGEDVVIYDVRNNSPFVSYYIVCSASNERRMRSLLQVARESVYDNYKVVDHVEGKNDSKWLLIDSKDIVIHLFTKDERERVSFDTLYKDVPHKTIVQTEEPVYRRKKKIVASYQG